MFDRGLQQDFIQRISVIQADVTFMTRRGLNTKTLRYFAVHVRVGVSFSSFYTGQQDRKGKDKKKCTENGMQRN